MFAESSERGPDPPVLAPDNNFEGTAFTPCVFDDEDEIALEDAVIDDDDDDNGDDGATSAITTGNNTITQINSLLLAPIK